MMGDSRISSFLLSILLFCLALIDNIGVEASHHVYIHLQNYTPRKINKLLRTTYHFQPKKHWMNDPNGPMYYKGLYHLFYQYNPKGSVWGNIVWGHSVSTDLINWQPLDPAIHPSKKFDKFGCWSGSATILPGDKPIMIYTGITDEENTQVQAFAEPDDYEDPYLEKWVRPSSGNPIIEPDEKDMNKTAFRDPSTAWLGPDGEWRLVVGGRMEEKGIAHLYKSKDFKKWTKAEDPLHSKEGTGMWECPDFYPVNLTGQNGMDTSSNGNGVIHVLKVSLDEKRYEYYTIGMYNTDKDKFTPDKTKSIDGPGGLRYDYGNFYASKTFYDPSRNRRVLWGWVNESDSSDDDVGKGWAGIMAFPRKVWLDGGGKQLIQWPVDEIKMLRGNNATMNETKIGKGMHVRSRGTTANQADVEVTFSFPSLDKAEKFDPSWNSMEAHELCELKGSSVEGGVGPFGLLTLTSPKFEEYTPVFYRIFKTVDNSYKTLMCTETGRSSLKNKAGYKPTYGGFVNIDLSTKEISLRTLIDHSVIESFAAGGKTCITARVYPSIALHKDSNLYVFNNGTEIVTIKSFTAWNMNRPYQMNN